MFTTASSFQVSEEADEAPVATPPPPKPRILGKPPLLPPPAPGNPADAAGTASNFSEQILKLGSAAAAARQSLAEALGATDAVARGVSGLTGGPVSWHHRLSEVCPAAPHALMTS